MSGSRRWRCRMCRYAVTMLYGAAPVGWHHDTGTCDRCGRWVVLDAQQDAADA